ncbi:MAG TPA: GNAT family N-acetyltransferase [Solirubrobacteraceae bacterium]|jgi:GNAT superfamily N-acetyltransferase|nr:GNAT family N-acetyltransferase [Solirubrobacteraceae bacterium]
MVDVALANEQAATVRKGSAGEVAGMAGALARAFHDDPAFSWVLRGDLRRMRPLRRGFELFLRRVWLDDDETYTTADAVGAAVWEPPGAWRHGVGEQLRLLPATVGVFGRHVPRVLRSLAALEAGHPAEPEFAPHYYLAFLGVDPVWQGRGLGSALIAPVLARCDRDGVPAFLEASTPRNRAMYERHGFRVLGEFRLGRGAPPQWRMWREPRPRGAA